MLSSNTQMTPRPRPPAKLRRSSSQTRVSDNNYNWRNKGGAPPPPYAPFPAEPLPTLLGTPVIATSQLIHLEEVCEDESQLQEKSKEELEELLRRTSEIIKERERELDMTSETCRTLAENNASLKARNDSLISRLPPSQPSSPLVSPSIHSASLRSPVHSRASSHPLLLSPKPFSSQISIPWRPAHARRISSTPGELAALADQNAELLAKLADLEVEASRTEQSGKRRLKNLEAEIENLRDELERAREESKRLEETVQAAPVVEGLPRGLDKQVVKMFKRLSREAKVRELKAKTRPWDREQGESSGEPKNFAPDNLTPGLPYTSKIVSRKVSAPNLYINTSLASDQASYNNNKSVTGVNLNHVDSPLSSVPPSATSTIGPNAREQALVSQLLLKIRELEETNSQLAENHLQASIRLREAQTESESVRRLCEFISDEVEGDLDLELELVQDSYDSYDGLEERKEDEGSGKHEEEEKEKHDNSPADLGVVGTRKTVRLRTVDRKTSMDFGSGSTRHGVRLRRFKSVDCLPALESSPPPPTFGNVRGNVGAELVLGAIGGGDRDKRPLKARKTVLGLFEEGSPVELPALPLTRSFNDPASFDQHHQLPLHSVRESSLNSPDIQAEVGLAKDGDINLGNEGEGEMELSSHVQSLGSELGLELENQGLRPAPGLGHAWTKSIMELLHSHESPAAPPTTLIAPVSSINTSSPHPHPHSLQTRLKIDRRTEGEEENGGYFPPLFPPALPTDERIIYPRLRKAKSSAVFGTLSPASRGPVSRSSATSTRPSGKPSNMNYSNTKRRRRNSLPSSSSIPNDLTNHDPANANATKSPPLPNTPKNNFERLRMLLLEVWLWLYFAAVILVFVFSMARKGPKVMLNKNKNGKGSGSAAAGR